MNAILGLSKVFRAAIILAGVLPSSPPSGPNARSVSRPRSSMTSIPLPKDYRSPGEWAFARLMYPPVGRYYGGFQFLGSWKEGASNWTMDYPALRPPLRRGGAPSDAASARVPRSSRSIWTSATSTTGPGSTASRSGHWDLTDEQAKTMREYLLRGGFFMCDDFHGAIEWDVFAASMQKVFPDRPIVDLESEGRTSSTSSTISTTATRCPARCSSRRGLTYEKGESGKTPHWRGIYDDHGRLMVAICHNMDLGDSWEHADNPEYPEKFSALGIRIGINYVVYSMTH